jgi:hypothetical protein
MKETVKVIRRDKLIGFIKDVSIIKALEGGEIRCINCGKPVSINNIHSIGVLHGQMVFSCDSCHPGK